ncbi:hypothetical protein Lal_00038555, partial [Lupinus albus]
KNEQNNENKESSKVVLLKALIHCDGCSSKIIKCLRGLEGVDQITIERENNKVIVKGDIVKDPMKVLETLQKKYSKNVELISPKPKPEKQKIKEKKEEPKVVLPEKTVVLKMYIHCEGCESDIKKIIGRLEGTQSVEVNRETSQVIVKGTMDTTKVVECVKKQLGKHAEIIKNEQKKEVKPKEIIHEKSNNNNNNNNNNKPIILYSYPSQYSTQYLYPNQTFNDENVFACSIM